MGGWLRDKLPDRVDVAGMLAGGRFVDAKGAVVHDADPYRPHTFVWFHRDLRAEPVVPGELTVLHRDERLVVVDKPAFLSTIPRGRHVAQSVVVRLRDELGLPELSPVHRLDRVTSGVLVLTTERRWRGAYQGMFQHRRVHKAYRALAPLRPDLELPLTVRNHLRKDRGAWQVTVDPDAQPNAETLVELDAVVGGLGVYRLTPRTGRTHQLRAHLCGLGIPIVGDPLYPAVLEVDVDDFSTPLQLLAHEVSFTDPVDGGERRFTSRRDLPLTTEPGGGDAATLR
ncbi:RNA pseudouridine synthase [Aeromicrobium marinum DSM 15272]|uniref:RNA pseudouridylate synthase n=1 Tax=Aeromicrobium marinum DSM 15272 TaxID=585531 RepID=E2S9N3_9ACTN|nr:pseudouridine synthase [Aeromicrobium marinum]EFQ83957.1 RNA pseudouridine synthase [Aeromicrobium marinum DSM 15272]